MSKQANRVGGHPVPSDQKTSGHTETTLPLASFSTTSVTAALPTTETLQDTTLSYRISGKLEAIELV